MSLPPCMPSEPMPVRITARMPPLQTSIAEVNSGSTAGLQKFTSGPSSSAIAASAPLAHDPHVAAAGREIDAARLDRLAVDGLVRGPPARARQMLGQNGGEGRRHVLGDQHRGAVDHRADARRPASSAPAGRRSRSRSAAPAAPGSRTDGRSRAADGAAPARRAAAARCAVERRAPAAALGAAAGATRAAAHLARRAGGSSRSARGGSCRRRRPRGCSPASGCSRRRRATAPSS